ncbi:SLC28A3 [Cordylochernes scorpioides]|uniref:SLC28A3 n=1 Tax=Cordylochernes scorpioides TaxID=51811 RepID=A0ABY6L544_9ARAC|nr:SLC28A3 [Cordylochernes scorpioides]
MFQDGGVPKEAELATNANFDKRSLGPWERVLKFLRENSRILKIFLKVAMVFLYHVYLGVALRTSWAASRSWCDGVKFLTLITILVYVGFAHFFLLKPLLKHLAPRVTKPKCVNFQVLRWVWWSGVLLSLAVFLALDTNGQRTRLISAGGLVVFILLGYLFSSDRSKVLLTGPRSKVPLLIGPMYSSDRSKIQWSTVLSGIFIQFIMGLMVLRWSEGREFVACFSGKIETFMSFTDTGSAFVFGYLVRNVDPDMPAVFAFKVLMTVVFFGFVTSILFYYGILQVVVIKVGWLLQVLMGTTACESMNAAASIFLGMISASHLLSASVMSAPAALAYAKLLYPESEESVTLAKDIRVEKGSVPPHLSTHVVSTHMSSTFYPLLLHGVTTLKEQTVLEAASNGAVLGLKLVAGIVANVIGFIAFLNFLDSCVQWLGELAGMEYISFKVGTWTHGQN